MPADTSLRALRDANRVTGPGFDADGATRPQGADRIDSASCAWQAAAPRSSRRRGCLSPEQGSEALCGARRRGRPDAERRVAAEPYTAATKACAPPPQQPRERDRHGGQRQLLLHARYDAVERNRYSRNARPAQRPGNEPADPPRRRGRRCPDGGRKLAALRERLGVAQGSAPQCSSPGSNAAGNTAGQILSLATACSRQHSRRGHHLHRQHPDSTGDPGSSPVTTSSFRSSATCAAATNPAPLAGTDTTASRCG